MCRFRQLHFQTVLESIDLQIGRRKTKNVRHARCCGKSVEGTSEIVIVVEKLPTGSLGEVRERITERIKASAHSGCAQRVDDHPRVKRALDDLLLFLHERQRNKASRSQ